ncbi:MAG: histidinol-phosphatase [Bacteroidota bacterium]
MNKGLTQNWYKGNLHTHSLWSDGDEFPERILDWYKDKGYHFLALSDHNTVSEGDKWITVSEDSLLQRTFQRYLEAYGEDWVKTKIDSGRTLVKLRTFREYRDKIGEPGAFLVIHAEEISDRFQSPGNAMGPEGVQKKLPPISKPVHMGAINVKELIPPQGGNTVTEVIQNNIDALQKQRAKTGVPMMLHLNHPNFYYAVSPEDIMALKGERFFEVYNGHPMVHNMGDSTHISTEDMWDLINISYLEDHKPLLYGLATDDTHHYHNKASKWSNAGRGWVMVQADTLSAPALIDAMEKGDFYASTGVTLQNVENVHNTLNIIIQEEPGVSYELTLIGCKKGGSEPEELKSVTGTRASFKLSDDLLFARCRITSSKLQENPIENIFYEMAWTQPVLCGENP